MVFKASRLPLGAPEGGLVVVVVTVTVVAGGVVIVWRKLEQSLLAVET